MFTDMQDMILSNDGTIYGGFVRDMVLRDTANLPMQLTLPDDIDCYFRYKSDARGFLSQLSASNFRFTEEVREGYAMSVHRIRVTHVMFTSGNVRSYIREALSDTYANHFTVYIDITYGDGSLFESPFKRYDFMCNAMYLTAASTMPRVAKSLLDDMNLDEETVRAYIFNDISCHRAVINATTPPVHRVANMLRHSWVITDINANVILTPNDVDVAHPSTIYRRLKACAIGEGVETDDVCLICLDEFGVGQTCLRNKCCNARYHEGCYGKTFDRVTQCPQCRCPV
ncbi:hypothetical protein FOA52_004351 [Chlamydomonas sp. UWO 241]|nr:hypothetical protein FOA52_011839 [Chlamydomonas sp. UWO 241]KAG1656965.1 hypothetical protein FOA52_004351 [Chlamydomonas sp. UWO 241]